MRTNEQVDDMREVCVEAWNMLFGRAIFAFLFLPDSWVTGYQMNDPLVTNRFLYKDRVWVGSGEIECLISRRHSTEKRPNLDFRAKIVVELKKDTPIAPSPETLLEHHFNKGREVVEHGELHSGDHIGSYILWASKRPRFGFFGSPRLNAQLIGFVPCDETSRLIKVIWTSPTPELIIEESDVLISSLNSLLCHGHDIESYEDDLL
ncbi:MAG: hypothetical protein ACFFAD_11415 [Candidatus Hermodarchaeota archaeon]